MAELKTKPHISIVVPVYNGAGTLADLFTRTSRVMADASIEFEMLFVDDGSTDHSWKTIQELKRMHGCRVKGYHLARNSGQQAATLCGLANAGGCWIVTLDDDLLANFIPAKCSRLNRFAALIKFDLASHFIIYGTNHAADAVQVFDLCPHPVFLVILVHDADVCLKAQHTL